MTKLGKILETVAMVAAIGFMLANKPDYAVLFVSIAVYVVIREIAASYFGS